MGQYAKATSVSVEKTVSEIRSVIMRYGATAFGTMENDGRAAIMFEMHGKRLRFVLPLPSISDPKFAKSPGRKLVYNQAQRHAAWEQACRTSWRALFLVIKAKLEAVESGISCFEEEFLANIILPDNRTVGQFMLPQLEAVYAGGKMPKLLPGVE